VPTPEELRPVVVVENDRPEMLFAAGEDSWGVAAAKAAVAGNFGWVGLFNPVDSGVIGVIEYVRNRGASLISAQVDRLTPPGTPPGSDALATLQGNRDTRRGTLSQCGLQLLTGSAAGGIAGQGAGTFEPVNTHGCESPPGWHIEVAPGGFAVFMGNAVNTIVTIVLYWRTRTQERGISS
jgi:hypothetical protein